MELVKGALRARAVGVWLLGAFAAASLVLVYAVTPSGQMLPGGSKTTPVALTVFSSASLPPEVQAQEAASAPLLFDRDTNTMHAAFAESSVQASFESPREVRAIKVFGAAPYLLTVKADVGGSFQTIDGLQDLKLMLLPSGWTSFSAVSPVTTGKLLFVLTPATGGSASGLRELEIWTSAAPVSAKNGAALLERLLGATPPAQARLYPALNPTANPTVGVVTPNDNGGDLADNKFSFTLDRDPAHFVRAYLTYELFGQQSFINVRRTLNGLTSVQSPAGGGLLIPTPAWSAQVERINPAHLKPGTNTVEFGVVSSSFKEGGYTVRNVRVVAELDNGANAIEAMSSNQPDAVGSNPVYALYDGDLETGWRPYPTDQPVDAVAPELEFTLRRPTQMEAVSLYLSAPLSGEVKLSIKQAGQWLDFPAEPALAFDTGWNTIYMPPSTPIEQRVVEAVKLKFSGGTPGGAEIREFLFFGSAVGGRTSPPKLTVVYPDAGQFYGRRGYVQGFVEPWNNGSGFAKITLGGISVSHLNGTIETWVNKNDIGLSAQADGDPWSAELKVMFPNGETASTIVEFNDQKSAASPVNGTIPGALATAVGPKTKKTISHDESKLVVDSGTVSADTTLTIQPLAEADVPALDLGMVNVTKGPRRGYRFLPHGARFLKNVNVTLPYDRALIPPGHTEDQVQTFFFDDQAGRWVPLTRVSLDTTGKLVNSVTNHFTDMINAVVTVPDHPLAASFNPTSMKDIKAADPGAQVNLIEPPRGNNQGDARLTYPIEVPPGRQGLQPQLAVSYSSSGGNGWMGMGWDIPVRAITIDTRWGVPRYSSTLETETYLLDGEQLTPVAHRGDLQPRSAEKVFHTRVEGQFRRIVRHGTAPSNYWWEITDKNGTRYFYGGTPENNAPLADGVLADPAVASPAIGNIFKWVLKEVRDANGNSLKYHCEVVENRAPGTEPWRQIYLRRMTYTGSVGVDGPYEVIFNRESGRTDVTVDGRPGFKTVMDQRLASIEVRLTTAASPLVRRYVFEYRTGAFRKTLLNKVTQLMQDGVTAFNAHRFEYFDEVTTPTPNIVNAFGPLQSFGGASTVTGDGLLSSFTSTAFGGSATANRQVHFYGGVGAAAKEISAGFKVGSDSGNSTTKLSLLDIDGDGVADQVFRSGGGFAYRSNTSGAQGTSINFGPAVEFGMPDLGRENTSTTTFGVQGFAIGINGLADRSVTRTRGDAYISDVNGDGLPDVVTGGTVFFNRLVNGRPAFDLASPTPLGSGAASNTSGLVTDPNEGRAEIEDANHLVDPLRRWVAPYSGTVSITGDVRLVNAPAAGYATADGVRAVVQHNGAEIFSGVLDNPTVLTPTPITGLTAVPVIAGDRIYFRINSRNDGSFDEVEFNPTITYTAFDPLARDENALPVFVYNGAADYAYGGAGMELRAPANGQATLAGSFVKSAATSDDVVLQIVQNGTILASHTIAANQTATVPVSQALTTFAGDRLLFRIHADSRVDLTKVRFAPTLTYTVVDGSPAPQDANGNSALVIQPPVTAQIYPQQSTTPYAPVIASQTGTLTVSMSLALGTTLPSGYSADVTLTVKKQNLRMAKQRIEIRNGAIVGPASFTANIPVTAGEALYFTAASTTDDLAAFASANASYTFGAAEPTPTPVDLHLAASPNEAFGGGYRRWSYGQYNGNNAAAAVDETRLRRATGETDQVFRFFAGMLPFQNEDRFRVQDEDAFITASRMSSTRLGVKFLDFPDGTTFGGARGIVRYGGARNRAGSISVLGFGAGTSSGDNWSDIDFLDLNGDRYPDVVGGGAVQPTLPNGALEGARLGTDAFGRVRESQSETTNVTLGATTQALRTSALGKLLGIYSEQASYNLSAGVSGGRGEFTAKWDLVDINGDGLPDYVKPGAGGLAVRLNLGYGPAGYRFGVEENWGGSGTLRFEKSANKGVNAGFTTPAYSFGGGISHTISKTGTQQDLLDINGDGLPDIVTKEVNDDADSGSTAFSVRLNTGNGFTEAMVFDGALPKPIRQNATVSRNLGAHFTYSICWPVPPICLIFNPGAYRGASLGGFEVQVADFNGDGYPDHIYSDTNGNVEVRLNNHGRTNLLKKVHRPLGATFDVEYTRSGNTQDQPQSRWVMSKVTVFDGHAGEGADTQLTTFQYLNGKYDRAERDFYGYAATLEEHRDTQNLGSLYRSIRREFLTDSYYTKGLLRKELLQDSAGRPFTETENSYTVVDVADGAAVPGLADFSATRFPQLAKTDRRFYEGLATPGKTTFTTNEYDLLGNIIRFADAGDLGATDDVLANIEYTNCGPSYISKPKRIEVRGNGAVMRVRDGNIDCTTGNLTQVRQSLADLSVAITDLTYFQNGNLQTVTGPANRNGQRYTLTYEYDPQVQTHVARITDSFGLSSQATYNLHFGKVETTLDTNNNQTTNLYDGVGRITRIFGPYEQGQATATLSFDYQPDAAVPNAITRHVDKDADGNGKSSGTIDTILFTDGLKRVIQTKKDATVLESASAPQDRMIVSGQVTFDAFGRTVAQRYPTVEPKAPSETPNRVFNAIPDGEPATTMTFDVLDRNTRTTIPDGSFTTLAYGFGLDRSNSILQFETVVTDANRNAGQPGAVKRTYRNVRELITSVKELNKGATETIWTSYAYDALKQIVQVVDDKLNTTKVEYDNLGRRTVIDNPDAGKTETRYDLASNVTQKITANLRSQARAIDYNYDFNRLTSITYPNFLGNSVSYTYGLPGAPFNSAGRITRITSQMGVEERQYGKLGETVYEKKSVVTATGPSPKDYETRMQFDTFGRLLRITYPDGETVTNVYDSGGNLASASGVKRVDNQNQNHRYHYLQKLHYDKFEQRAFVEQGNGVKTAYTYDARTRRLSNLNAVRQGNNIFQNLAYSYDKVGNVLGLQNQVEIPPANTFGGPTAQIFAYDDLYRLTHAEGTYRISPNKTHTYRLDLAYDTIHNILRKDQLHQIVQPSSTAITQKKTSYDFAYAYAPSGPTSVRPHAPTHIGERTYTYDANGNQTRWDHDGNGTRRNIVWDDENRIQSLFDNGHEKTYRYDDQGNRVIKRGPQGETVYVNQFYTDRPGANATKHVYAGTTRVASKLMRQDGPGSNPAGKTPFEKDLYFYHPDHLGSSSFITDLNGKLYEHLLYFPFGEGWVEENSNQQRTPYHFTAKELDEETGLYYFGARYYDPRTSVWQSADPILGYLLSTPEQYARLPAKLALYSYGLQQPLIHVDPDGRDAVIVAFTDYKVGTPMGRVPYLGHAGIILIDNKTGVTRYYEYGRYDKEQRGIVVRRTVPNVVMGQNGSPTQESMTRLLKAVSKEAGKGSRIEGAYIKNDNFKEMVDRAEALKAENDDPKRKPYGEVQNNCWSFCTDVANAGGASTPLSIIDWPNQDIDDLQEQYPSVRFDPKSGGVGGMLYRKPSGIRENIKEFVNKILE